MPTSSTGAVYSGSNATGPPNVPNSPTYGIDRYLGRNDKATTEHQRSPPGFVQPKSEHVAKAEAEARMAAQLRDFDRKFGGRDNSTRK
ncbi:hypothetical protein TARUN_2262 [Trichoderma arundinaceum]|uniref:Uncharacterized protein n=1 Tax=Trichoderma arundinaceum TaxID=490622 RepID=A0A395NV25_TRIAR|nr:hypothetical protein TARUN_2262 [Trichoderma arundinaceum]